MMSSNSSTQLFSLKGSVLVSVQRRDGKCVAQQNLITKLYMCCDTQDYLESKAAAR